MDPLVVTALCHWSLQYCSIICVIGASLEEDNPRNRAKGRPYSYRPVRPSTASRPSRLMSHDQQ